MGETGGPAPRLSCEMPFIISSNVDKFDQATRRRIRSHVMRGKKMRKTNRPAATDVVSAEPDSYRNYLQAHTLEDTTHPRIALWHLMGGAVSFFNISKELWLGDYLRRQAERCGAKTWKEVQNILKSCMWVTLLDDMPGKRIYNSLTNTAGAPPQNC
jgi:hypothetical protein